MLFGSMITPAGSAESASREDLAGRTWQFGMIAQGVRDDEAYDNFSTVAEVGLESSRGLSPQDFKLARQLRRPSRECDPRQSPIACCNGCCNRSERSDQRGSLLVPPVRSDSEVLYPPMPGSTAPLADFLAPQRMYGALTPGPECAKMILVLAGGFSESLKARQRPTRGMATY